MIEWQVKVQSLRLKRTGARHGATHQKRIAVLIVKVLENHRATTDGRILYRSLRPVDGGWRSHGRLRGLTRNEGWDNENTNKDKKQE
jgi:hypothetical protein